MNQEVSNLISRLLFDTQLKKIQWSSSSVKDEYRLEMQTGSLLITWKEQEGLLSLSFFRNLANNQLLCMAKSGEPDFDSLSQLYNAIQYSFSATVGSIMSELYNIEK